MPKIKKDQQGQTLIETLVAVFILTMGIGAALGLASYSLNSTQSIRKQIIAMGLAREGIEAVKHMRDTNWLRDTLDTGCFDYGSTGQGNCYRNWLNVASGYTIPNSASGEPLYLTMDTSQELMWSLQSSPGSSDKYELVIDPGQQNGYYEATGNKINGNTEAFGRKITIDSDNMAPFNQDYGPRLKVTVEVWWTDRKCPVTNTPPTNSRCKVTLETYLTNWKNF